MKMNQSILLAAGMVMSMASMSEDLSLAAGSELESVSAEEVNIVDSLEISTAFLSGNIASEGLASAQSTFPGYSAQNINDGDRNTTVGGSYSWANGHTYTADGRLPQWVQLAYKTQRTFSKVVLYTSSGYELKDYNIQVLSGSNWITVVSQRGNTSTTRIHTFTPTAGTVIRVQSLRGPDNQAIYARVNELEVYETSENLALNATVSAQSTFPGYSPSKVNDGDKNTRVGGSYSWANGHTYTADGRVPQWLELDFNGYELISSVTLYTSLGYEIQDYDVQIWTGSSWTTVVTQTGNTSVSRTHSFSPVIGAKLRIVGRKGPNNQTIYVRINELEVY